MTVVPPTHGVAQGATDTIRITITRTGSFTGAVTITIKDQSGTVRGTGTIAMGATTAAVPFTVPAGFTVGTNTWTVTGSGTGISDVTVNATITVIVPPASTSIAFQDCNSAHSVVWAAFADGPAGTPYQQVVTANNTAAFGLHEAVGSFVWAINEGNGTYLTEVYSYGATELQNAGAGFCGSTSTSTSPMSATVTGLGNLPAAITLGPALANVYPESPAVTVNWTSVPNGTQDLLAAVGDPPGRGYLQRGITVPGGTLALDLSTPNTFALSTLSMILTNAGSDLATIQQYYRTANGNLFISSSAQGTSGSRSLHAMPTAQTQPSDLYLTQAVTTNSMAPRSVYQYSHTLEAGMTLVLPNGITFTPTKLTTTAPMLAQVAGSVDTLLNQLWVTQFVQSATAQNRTVKLSVSNTYIGAAVTYRFAIPDLSGVGYQPIYGFQPGTEIDITATAYGSNAPGGALAQPTDGTTLWFASALATLH